MDEHPLRSLARDIRRAAEKHPNYFQVQYIIFCCCDHVNAIASVHERNDEVMRLLKKEPERERID